MILTPRGTFFTCQTWILNACRETVFDHTVSRLRFSFHMLRYALLTKYDRGLLLTCDDYITSSQFALRNRSWMWL